MKNNMKTTEKLVKDICRKARKSSYELFSVRETDVNKALRKMALLIRENTRKLKSENQKDLDNAREKGLSEAMIDRLTLSDKVLKSMSKGLREVASLKSRNGKIFDERVRPNGLRIYKKYVPIGVVGIIYESRPNVTVDAASITLKSGNAVILRGGSESYHSNMALVRLFSKALKETGLPKNCVQFINTTDRDAVKQLLTQAELVDLVIPRGGEGLIRFVAQNSLIPVIKHYKGVCHLYVSANADFTRASEIAVNAKVQRPGVCNSMETLLLDSGMKKGEQKRIVEALIANGVMIYGDTYIKSLDSRIKKAKKADWEEEYLDLRLSVKTVDGVDSAIDHINKYGSNHTDAILSKDRKEVDRFVQRVDSSSVMVNTTTRFSDGGEYGMGCEIGISTDKLHARGPMGIDDLTTYKWVVRGKGQIRE